MKPFDLSNPPKGATHWDANPNRTPSFMKLENGNWFFWPVCERAEARKLGWQPWNRSGAQVLKGLTLLVPTWNGEGLPPVGLEVEVLWSSQWGTYVRGKVVAHDDGRAVFRFLDGERAGEYQAERVSTYNDGKLTNFRPIRTAEQIAAEERSETLQDLALLIDEAHGNDKTFAEAIYDAGYRKA